MSQPAGDERQAAAWRLGRQKPEEATTRSARRHRSPLREVVGTVLGAILVSLFVKTLLVQAFFIPSGSMEPVLHGCNGCVGDRVLVNKVATRLGGVHRGDIVVFQDSSGWLSHESPTPGLQNRVHDALVMIGLAPSSNEGDLVKRVIGVGGDTVEGRDGNVYVNGKELREPYVFPGDNPSEIDFRVIVPGDKLWVMGDHRSESADSRFHVHDPGKGFVPTTDVVGQAFVIVWPPARVGTLD